MTYKFHFIALLVFLISNLEAVCAQKKDENIGTEVVNVVKPYTPSISDAFKVKETPTLDDEETNKKEAIPYTIFPFPVASTFVPSKGKAAKVEEAEEEKRYKNYFTGGIGNYFNTFAELYVTQNVAKNDYIAGTIQHFSSNGGIKGLAVNDRFLTSSAAVTYGSIQNEFSWNSEMGFQIQKYQWYGLPSDFKVLSSQEINNLNVGQLYSDFYLGGEIKFKASFFKGIAVKYNRFWDKFSSSENRLLAKPTFAFDINEKTITTEMVFDCVNSTFSKDVFGTTSHDFGYANIGMHPNYTFKKEDWTVNLGAAVYCSLDTKNSKSNFYVYPKINASIQVVGDYMIFYSGADGQLQQNSYRDFTNQNPFLSPNCYLAPTDTQFELLAGLKGKLSAVVSYNIKGAVVSEKNKALFLSNPYFYPVPNQEQYRFGNSFGIVYDDLKTARIFGELKADFNKNSSFGINATLNSYTTNNQKEAWNLPLLQLNAHAELAITKKISFDTSLFYVGNRKDNPINQSVMTLVAETTMPVIVKGYFDANATTNYKYNERFTAFLKLNNLANQAYQKWLNYPVQSFQVLLGGNYKFDF